MSEILLSINPEYANRILNKSKKYEYRKKLPIKNVDKIIIYSTYPVMKVIGEVDVIEILSMKKTPLWEKTKKLSGISKRKYDEYFDDCSIAHAYRLGDVRAFEPPKALIDFGIETAPQSFVYIK